MCRALAILVLITACGAPPSSRDAGVRDAAIRTRHDVLFVGNSYVHVNDIPGHYRAITSALYPSVRAEAVTTGGYRLEQHAMDARTDGTALARWLRTGTPEETSFDAVVLQEQSQIGGFPANGFYGERTRSIEAALELAALATQRGARVVLYHTWGREHGDPQLGSLGFETYESMQDRLDAGYLGLAALLREHGSTVDVAPVGGGFRIVYEDVLRAGGDPGAEGSEFDALYEPDGSHPSARGAYLAACILAGTITRADVRAFADEPVLGGDVSARLRDACARALEDPRWHVPTIVRPDAVLRGDGVAGAYFGESVATDASGARILVGATGRFPSLTGTARLFERSADHWAETARWDGASGYASSLAISGDGSRVLIGPPTSVHVESGPVWREEAALAPGPSAARESAGLAFSADGSRAIVSAPGDGPDTVLARVYLRAGGTWAEELVVEGIPVFPPYSAAVALDTTGERAILGALGENPPRIFARTEAGWSEEATLSLRGPRVAISADGTRALVGSPTERRVVVYTRAGSTWTEQATLRGLGTDFFGATVALTADGGRVVVGAPRDAPVAMNTGSGSVRVYRIEGDTIRHELLLVPPAPPEGTQLLLFGASLAITPDGTRVVVGAPYSAPDAALYAGLAYTFSLPAPP